VLIFYEFITKFTPYYTLCGHLKLRRDELMKVAIIGAGLSGLTCALELEKKGIIPDIFEKDNNVGWAWSEVSYWPFMIYNDIGDPRDYLKNKYEVDIKPITVCHTNIMKSPNQKITIQGNLGYLLSRGKGNESLENQLQLGFRKVAIQYNTPTDYKELSKKYDWVVLSTGRDTEARELNVWEDEGPIRIIEAVVIGNFDPDASTLYFNTEYAGTGHARLTPFNSVQAILSLYVIGLNNYDTETLFKNFIQTEGLSNLELICTITLPIHYNGRVTKTKVGNILLTGKSAGLTESLIGTGGVEALISGVLAGRSIADNQDYEALVKPLQIHSDNISAFRKIVNTYNNTDFDKLLSFLDTPVIKQLMYNTKLPFTEITGELLKKFRTKIGLK
jgi:digeranylgeranylglycerophospholipid reductase